jgi:phage baseplate assembly protein W
VKKTILDNTSVIDLPFTLSTKGKVNAVADNSSKAWKNKVLTLLSTGIGERIWYYNYGANLNELLFETSSEAIDLSKAAISEMFAVWAPELILEDLIAEYDETMASITFSIIYRLPNGETDSVKIITSSLTAAGETIEVL